MGTPLRICLRILSIPTYITGFLYGSEDYYKHTFCYPLNIICGHDFWDNDQPLLDVVGTYTAELFATRAEELVKLHSEQNKDEVVIITNALCDEMSDEVE